MYEWIIFSPHSNLQNLCKYLNTGNSFQQVFKFFANHHEKQQSNNENKSLSATHSALCVTSK